VFGIFIKKEYGDIRRQSIIVDVGANIGVYALYAAQQQAGQVFAYEPNSEAYECLVQSVRDSHLEGLVVPQRTAVLGAAKGAVRFPVKSNVHNAIIQDASNTDFEWVNTSSISDIVMRLGRADLLKLDCEGAEYDILFSAEAAVYDRINSVRMEYHLVLQRPTS